MAGGIVSQPAFVDLARPQRQVASVGAGSVSTSSIQDAAVTADKLASGLSSFGKHGIWVPVTAMRPTVSNGCAVLLDVEPNSVRPNIQVLDFDAGTDEHAQFVLELDNSWNLGTVTFKATWTVSAAVSTGVAIALQGVAVSDNETINVAYGTAIVVTDNAQGATTERYQTAESAAVTVGGTPADGDTLWFRVFRDVSDGNDDMTQDMRLIGITLFVTTDAGTGA